MKKLIILCATIFTLSAALLYADTSTPRLGLVEPTIGSTGWGVKINSNMAVIDSGTAVLGQANIFTGANTFQAVTGTTGTFTNMNVTSSGTVNGNFLISGIISAGSTPLAITTSDGHLDATKLTGTVSGVINNQATLQSGSTFYVSSGTVNSYFAVIGSTLNVNAVHYIWPPSQGSASTNLQNDGSGNLTWVSPAGGGTVNSGSANQIAFYPSAGTTISSTGTVSVFPSSVTVGDTTHSVTVSSNTTINATLNVTTVTPTNIVGQANANTAPTGDVGEVIMSSTPYGSPMAFASGNNVMVATATLSAGCWNIVGTFAIKSTNAGTSITAVSGFLTVTSGVAPNSSCIMNQCSNGEIYNFEAIPATVPGLNIDIPIFIPEVSVCLASPTIFYIGGTATFTVSTAAAVGGLRATRIFH